MPRPPDALPALHVLRSLDRIIPTPQHLDDRGGRCASSYELDQARSPRYAPPARSTLPTAA